MVIFKFWYSFTILAAALASLLQTSSCEYDRTEEYYKQLFGSTTKRLSSSETLDYLKLAQDRTDNDELRKEVTVLIKIRELEGCTIEEAHMLNQLLTDNMFHLNVRNYISDVRGDYLNKCSDKFSQLIDRDSEELRDETKEDFPIVMRAIEKANNGLGETTPMTSRLSIAKGLTEFLGTKDCDACKLIKSQMKVKRPKLVAAYEKYIKTFCREFVNAMKTVTVVFKHSEDPKVVKATGNHKGLVALVDSCGKALDPFMPDELVYVIESNARANPAKKSLRERILHQAK